MKFSSKSQLFLWIFALLIGLTSFIIYPKLPATIPTHWNAMGEIDGYSGKSMIFFLAFLPLLMASLLDVFPRIDPKRKSYEVHKKEYNIVVFAIVLFMTIIYGATAAVALGYSVPVANLIKVCVAILFIIIGSVLKRFQHNYFFGIRTPWTLASEEVWYRTHNVGGYAFIAAGIFALLSIFFEGRPSIIIMFAPIILISLGLTIYSYVIFRQLQQPK